MAIVIEEEKRGNGFFVVLTWAIVIASVSAIVFYLFIKKPQVYEYIVSQKFKKTQQIVNINADEMDISKNPKIKMLKQYLVPNKNIKTGKENPFASF